MPIADLRLTRVHRGCVTCGEPTPADIDAAQRIADEMDYHLTAGKAAAIEVAGQWIAVRLSDGASDHQLYPTKDDAMRLAPGALRVTHPNRLLYVQVQLTGMPLAEAMHVLALFRQPWLRTDAPIDVENPFAHRPLTAPRGVSLPPGAIHP